MIYREYPAPPPLRSYVKFFWSLTHDYSAGSHREEWLAPSTEINVVFHRGRPFRLCSPQAGPLKQPQSFVIGPQKRFFVLRSDGQTDMVAIRFQPWGAFPFFRLPVSELDDQLVPLDAILGSEGRRLTERVLSCRLKDARGMLESFLIGRIGGFSEKDALVGDLVVRLQKEPDIGRVSKAVSCYSVSHRQVERRFAMTTGMSPKRFSRIVRFQHALGLIHSNLELDLSQVCYESGYFDQSHFVREFRELYGMTPGAVRSAAKGGMPKDFDVDFIQYEPPGHAIS